MPHVQGTSVAAPPCAAVGPLVMVAARPHTTSDPPGIGRTAKDRTHHPASSAAWDYQAVATPSMTDTKYNLHTMHPQM